MHTKIQYPPSLSAPSSTPGEIAHFGMFIDGKCVPAADGAQRQIVNPATERSIAVVPEATAEDVNVAVNSALEAFDAWAAETPARRATALMNLASAIEANADTLIALEVGNVGKPVEVARDDIEFSADVLRFCAGACRLLEGRASGEYIREHTSLIRREPFGVVGSLAPWNYPFLMAIWKMAPALAVGNTVVLKPSELTPLSTLALARLDVLPKGVLNVVTGVGNHAGAALVEHPGVAMISLTGDIGTGRKISEAAAKSLKNVHLELGGKAPAVVFEDADLAWVAHRVRRSSCYNTGQDCTAVTRLIVHKKVADKLVDLLIGELNEMRVGDPLDPKTTTGPLVSKTQQQKVADMVNRAQSCGAKVVVGGGKPDGPGFFYMPTLITNVKQTDEIVQKEVFGPVVTIQIFEDESEALSMANGVVQGLTASVWTQDVNRALRVTNKLKFGTVWVNDHTRLTAEMPHGGGKASGHGKEMSMYSLEAYTQVKHVMIRVS